MQRIIQAAKIRRTGNSNAVSLPPDFEELGYVVGARVVVVAMPSGELRILLQDDVYDLIRGAGAAGPAGASPVRPATAPQPHAAGGVSSRPPESPTLRAVPDVRGRASGGAAGPAARGGREDR